MFRVYCENNKYCRREVAPPYAVTKYADWREFAAALKRELENEATLSQIIAVKKRRKSESQIF